MPGERATWGVFLLVTFLCTSKEKLPARPKGRAHDAREGAVRTGMCAQRPPEPARALGGQDARRARYLGCVSFGYLSLHKQRKVTRSPAGRVKALHFKSNMDSRLRGNDGKV